MFISEQQMLLQIFFFYMILLFRHILTGVKLMFSYLSVFRSSIENLITYLKAQILHIKKCFWQETRVWLHLPVVTQSSANNDRLG